MHGLRLARAAFLVNCCAVAADAPSRGRAAVLHHGVRAVRACGCAAGRGTNSGTYRGSNGSSDRGASNGSGGSAGRGTLVSGEGECGESEQCRGGGGGKECLAHEVLLRCTQGQRQVMEGVPGAAGRLTSADGLFELSL